MNIAYKICVCVCIRNNIWSNNGENEKYVQYKYGIISNIYAKSLYTVHTKFILVINNKFILVINNKFILVINNLACNYNYKNHP